MLRASPSRRTRWTTRPFLCKPTTTNCIGCAECVQAVQREAPFDNEATWEEDTKAMLRRKFASYFVDGVPAINFLIFGCTHFPILEPLVRKIFGEGVALIDPAVYQVKLAAELGMSSERKGEEFSVSAAPHSGKLATFRNAARAIELTLSGPREAAELDRGAAEQHGRSTTGHPCVSMVNSAYAE